MRRCPFFLLMFSALFSLLPAFSQKIFKIGEVDSSYREFAIAGNYPLYSYLFPNDVDFKVGVSKGKTEFPYIHPGPSDAWAGSKVHIFHIKFHLERLPRPSVRLTLYLVNTHYSAPPLLAFFLNGKEVASCQLPPGGGDASLSDPAQGERWMVALLLNPKDFRLGENEISIENRRGSWFLYDAILLEEGLNLAKPEISAIKAKDVPFFIKEGEETKQVLQVRLANLGGEGKVDVALSAKGKRKNISLKVTPGEKLVEIPLEEEFLSAGEVRVKAGEAEAVVPVRRHRKWLVYLAPSVHTDIGYTDVQTNVIKRHNENIRIVMEECERNPNFKWNLEVAWQLENFLNDNPEEAEKLIGLLQKGQVALQALYANMLTGLCSPESLARVCLFAKYLSSIHHFPLDSAILTDVPSAIFPLPSILNSFGIKYLAEGINPYRARFPYPHYPFYWEGPDGKKVLFFPSSGYGWVRGIGLLESMESLAAKLLSLLEGLEKGDYPYDAYLLYGGFSDNELIDPRFMKLVEEWNVKYAYPKIIVATNSEFFRYLEERYKEKILTYKLDAGAYWEDGAVSTARELAMNREAKNWATEAETLFSLASLLNPSIPYPTRELKELWRNILLFDEHTWGAWCSISDPYAETTLKQWEIKASFAHNAYKEAEELREKAFQQFSNLVSAEGESILVFNPLSFPRSDIVRVRVPYQEFALFDGDREIPWQRDGEDVLFFLKDVPSLGYKLVRLEKRKPSHFPIPFQVSQGSIESDSLRVQYNEEGISSLYDKKTQREWIDKGKRLGDYLYLAGPEGDAKAYALSSGKVWVENIGPVFSDICFSSSAYRTPSFNMRLRIYKDLARCDLIVDIEKEETLDKESVFLSFPFALENPRVRLEYPTCVVEPFKEQFPQACRNWYTIHQWVGLDDRKQSLIWCSLDAPLLSLGQPIHKEWLNEMKLQKGYIFSYLMHNHWDTNYKASQGGKFRFRYAIFPLKGVVPNEEASKLAWGFAHPFIAGVIPPQKSLLSSAHHSFLEARGALLTTLKKREYGSGWILRLWRAERNKGEVELKVALPIRKVFLSNLGEEKGEELIFDKLTKLFFPSSALETLLLRER